jgi:hypothetical protein
MSLTAYSAIARFLAAAHGIMLEWLKGAQQQLNLDGDELRTWWYVIMEQKEGREKRRNFFSEVVGKANEVGH